MKNTFKQETIPKTSLPANPSGKIPCASRVKDPSETLRQQELKLQKDRDQLKRLEDDF